MRIKQLSREHRIRAHRVLVGRVYWHCLRWHQIPIVRLILSPAYIQVLCAVGASEIYLISFDSIQETHNPGVHENISVQRVGLLGV